MAGADTTYEETSNSPVVAPDTGPRDGSPSAGRSAWLVALSLATGLVAALFFAALPFVAVTESALTGALLCGFAVGWAMLWLGSRRFNQPQRWAAIPALFMAAGGLLLLAFGSPMREALSWMWPPILLTLVVWMVTRVRHDMRSRGGRVQLYVVITVLALCAVGGGWQRVREARETNPYLMSGQLIDVGGHELRLDCVGTGSPTVVLEPAAGGTSASMAWVAPAVASQTRVCVYDRAGRGGSQPADRPQDGAQVATDLHTLLHQAGETGPYVLAGHSFGGLYVRIFAAHYPDEVAGLVLIDSTESAEPAKSVIPPTSDETSYDPVGRLAVLASMSARVGLTRLYGDRVTGSLPARSEEQLRFDTAQASTVRSVFEEYLRGGDATRQAASLRDFGDKPLFVLTAGEHPTSWMTAQHKMTTLSTNSAQRVIDGATHQGIMDEKEHAAHVTEAVLAVVTSARTNQPLPTDH